MNDLSQKMQERLDKWNKRDTSSKKRSIPNQKSPGNYVARGRDYGDDLNEFEDIKAKQNNIQR